MWLTPVRILLFQILNFNQQTPREDWFGQRQQFYYAILIKKRTYF
jgi:hypothetical protein